MKKFLNSAEENLKNASGKEAIMAELADHFETKKEFYTEIGWGEEESEAKADEAMGDGEIIGQRLSSIHVRSGARQMLFMGGAFIITVVVPFTLSMTAISDFPETFIRPLIAAALSFIFLFIFTALALPLNMLNNYTVKEEQKIRSEMISIVRELERSFDGNVGNFKSYIENSEYDFYKEENEPKATHYFLARGNYGLWVETSCGDEGNSFYAEAKVQNVNCSQKDVFVDSDEAEKLAAYLGDDGYKELTLETSNCYYMTADEIFDEMSKINFTAYSVFVNENEAEYGYEWFSDIYLYVTFGHDYYTFTFKDGKCVDYVYTLD